MSSMTISMPNTCIYPEVVQTMPEKVPMMLAGKKMPNEDHWLDWTTCCHTYFTNKETLKAENYVTNVAGGIKSRCVALWYQANHVKLNKLSFKEFLSKCTGSFANLVNTMINDNSTLTSSTYHLDDSQLRTQLKLAMDPLLCSKVDKNEKISAEKDLDLWVDLVVITDKKRTCEREAHQLEVEEATQKILNNDKKRSASAAGLTDVSHSGSNPAQSSSSNPAPIPSYSGCPRLPQITETEFSYHTLTQADVDNAHNALPMNHPLKFAQPNPPITATYVSAPPQYNVAPPAPQIVHSHTYPPLYPQPAVAAAVTATADLPAPTAACLPPNDLKQSMLDAWFTLNEASLDSNDSRFVSTSPVAAVSSPSVPTTSTSVPFLLPHLFWHCAIDDLASPFSRHNLDLDLPVTQPWSSWAKTAPAATMLQITMDSAILDAIWVEYKDDEFCKKLASTDTCNPLV
ncbi:uncharacterized protein EV420DRAFT_1691643 [Desarmillaria tabescens]|uniref:Uncharacterized protein n=1 Tax=Armillaria tabescens TaxID=1929756 RepID=A0AA39N4Q2_ARMTA|nr:uncharacterized protein EV420DRAFT_1691643 [Desarmillaria tabescens]KAK0457190.1 hypothetical protein EV420DRAFT_1691643 [Desarmillaria tabescens]